MTDWTTGDVQDRLESAADVMRQLPSVKPQGYFNAWPDYTYSFADQTYSFADQVGQEPEMKRPRPTPRAITECEEAILWLRWLEIDDAKLVWARADRTAWKPICWRFGVSRTTAHRRWKHGLSVIVWRLNGKRAPEKRSVQFVINATR